MHEASLVDALFDHADRSLSGHPASAVRRMRVRIGARAGVEIPLFETAFTALRGERGYGETVLEIVPDAGTALVLERLELEVRDV